MIPLIKNIRGHLRAGHIAVLLVLLALLLPPGWLSAKSWEWGLRWLYVLLLAFLASSLLTPLCIALAHRFDILDIPDARKTHGRPIPRLGGLAIFLSVLLTVGRNFQFSRELTGLITAGTLIFVTGLIDDARGLSAKFRLAAQVAAALILVFFNVHITFVPPSVPGEHLWEILITV
ncbi:MAG TPA: hypothetical protein P5079_04040, partial [Elusimicrobiota bacterium]|nr:hypothetical protein [Elusimicrobiota bacterium]